MTQGDTRDTCTLMCSFVFRFSRPSAISKLATLTYHLLWSSLWLPLFWAKIIWYDLGRQFLLSFGFLCIENKKKSTINRYKNCFQIVVSAAQLTLQIFQPIPSIKRINEQTCNCDLLWICVVLLYGWACACASVSFSQLHLSNRCGARYQSNYLLIWNFDIFKTK